MYLNCLEIAVYELLVGCVCECSCCWQILPESLHVTDFGIEEVNKK